jgi:hypothetical protein
MNVIAPQEKLEKIGTAAAPFRIILMIFIPQDNDVLKAV